MTKKLSTRIPILTLIIAFSFTLFACQSKNGAKEKELMQKEIELLKKENELLQKEKSQKEIRLITVSDLEQAFNKYKQKIEGKERDCWTVNSFIGDLNGDDINDGLIHFSCGFKGNPGNASAGSGLAVFVLNGNDLTLTGIFEDFKNFVPDKITSGLIYGEELEYGPNDARCCPSIKTKVTLKFVNDKLEKVK